MAPLFSLHLFVFFLFLVTGLLAVSMEDLSGVSVLCRPGRALAAGGLGGTRP